MPCYFFVIVTFIKLVCAGHGTCNSAPQNFLYWHQPIGYYDSTVKTIANPNIQGDFDMWFSFTATSYGGDIFAYDRSGDGSYQNRIDVTGSGVMLVAFGGVGDGAVR